MAEQGGTLRDRHSRTANYVRLSLTDRCNFRCPFCMPPQGAPRAAADPGLAAAEFVRLVGVLASLGVDRFKVTGGEPFLNPDAVSILAAVAKLPAVRRVGVTTNGSSLERLASAIAAAGVAAVNVSLNAMRQPSYSAAVGVDFPLSRVQAGIERATGLGLDVKLNMVPLRGVNERDIVPLAAFALERGLRVKFIELMPIGQGRGRDGLPEAEVRRILEKRFGKLEPSPERFGDGPAEYWRFAGNGMAVGFIAALSRRFCGGCNRLRLSSAGYLRTCLHHDHGVDLAGPLRRGESDADLARRIREAVAAKPDGHRFGAESGEVATGAVPMVHIGG